MVSDQGKRTDVRKRILENFLQRPPKGIQIGLARMARKEEDF
jgi:hypothetical protein